MKRAARALPWLALCFVVALAGYFLGFQRGRESTVVNTHSRQSLIHFPADYPVSPRGIEAGRSLLRHLRTGSAMSLDNALSIYSELIPRENFGGEYATLQWVCQYLRADSPGREKMLGDPFARRFIRYLGANGFALLEEYLYKKYEKIDLLRSEKRWIQYLDEFVKFNDPRRKEWEKTDEVMKALALRKGASVADIGAGYGFYSFRFSEAVGEDGLVYAVEISTENLTYLKSVLDDEHIGNVQLVTAQTDDVMLEESSIDCAFICDLYHVIYGQFSDQAQEKFIGSITRALRRDGTLVVMDNAPLPERENPFFARRISKHLVIDQLTNYGFRLQKEVQLIPQRYILFFSCPEGGGR